jgi:hypothetical protein
MKLPTAAGTLFAAALISVAPPMTQPRVAMQPPAVVQQSLPFVTLAKDSVKPKPAAEAPADEVRRILPNFRRFVPHPGSRLRRHGFASTRPSPDVYAAPGSGLHRRAVLFAAVTCAGVLQDPSVPGRLPGQAWRQGCAGEHETCPDVSSALKLEAKVGCADRSA